MSGGFDGMCMESVRDSDKVGILGNGWRVGGWVRDVRV